MHKDRVRALLIATGATRGWADKGGKKEAGDSSINRQFDWENRVVIVHGCGGHFPAEGGELFLGNAGTAMR